MSSSESPRSGSAPGGTALDLSALADAVVERLALRLRAGPEPLLDRARLAERLGVVERTVSALVARGELPPPLLHTGDIARWDWAQVLRWLQGRQHRRRRTGRGRYPRDAGGDLPG